MDCSLPGPSVHGILQARILEWVAFLSLGALPNPGIEPTSPALTGRFFTTEPPGKPCLFSPDHNSLRKELVRHHPVGMPAVASVLEPHTTTCWAVGCPCFPGAETSPVLWSMRFLFAAPFPTTPSLTGHLSLHCPLSALLIAPSLGRMGLQGGFVTDLGEGGDIPVLPRRLIESGIQGGWRQKMEG